MRVFKKFCSFACTIYRKLSSKVVTPSQPKGVDLSKNLVYGGDLPNVTFNQAFGSILYNRMIQLDRREHIFQICSATKEQMTTNTVLQLAVALSEKLRKKGVEKGDFVLLFGRNGLNMNIALIGAFLLAAVPLPLSDQTRPEEFKIILEHIKPKLFGCDKEHFYAFKKTLIDISLYDSSRIFFLSKKPDALEPEIENFGSFIKGNEIEIDSFKPTEVNDSKEELALAMKATTDGAKGRIVGITHYNLNSIIARYDSNEDLTKVQNKVVLMVQRVSWMSGIYSLLLSCCFCSKLVVMSDFDEEMFMKAVEDYKVSSTFLYSSKLWQLYKYNYPKKYDLSSLKYLYAVDGSLAQGLIDGMKEKIGITLNSAYGLTEMTGLALQSTTGTEKTGSTGKLVPQVYGKVVSDKKAQNMGPNQKGEICFKGPTLSKGYINSVKFNKNLFDREGYILSGQYGYYDTEGDFFIIDRIYHVIKYKEYNISPRELEGIIKSLDAVKDVCVSGIKHKTDGYYPIAFVSLQKNQKVGKVSERVIIDHVNRNVEDYKRLRGGVIFISKIPRFRDTGAVKRVLFKQILSKYQISSPAKDYIESQNGKE